MSDGVAVGIDPSPAQKLTRAEIQQKRKPGIYCMNPTLPVTLDWFVYSAAPPHLYQRYVARQLKACAGCKNRALYSPPLPVRIFASGAAAYAICRGVF